MNPGHRSVGVGGGRRVHGSRVMTLSIIICNADSNFLAVRGKLILNTPQFTFFVYIHKPVMCRRFCVVLHYMPSVNWT